MYTTLICRRMKDSCRTSVSFLILSCIYFYLSVFDQAFAEQWCFLALPYSSSSSSKSQSDQSRNINQLYLPASAHIFRSTRPIQGDPNAKERQTPRWGLQGDIRGKVSNFQGNSYILVTGRTLKVKQCLPSSGPRYAHSLAVAVDRF